jgi:Ca2+-binding EF-hand superfamily protein
MQVHGNSTANPTLNAILAHARQAKSPVALGNSAVEAKPGLGEAKKAESANHTPAAAAQQPGTDNTLEGIRKHWGQSDSPYDLNGDGTVNVDDILHYIAGLANGQPDGSTVDPAMNNVVATDESGISVAAGDTSIPDQLSTTDPTSGQPLTLDGFNDHWGHANSQYDLNSDGTVNMDDLLAFINSQSTPIAPEISPPAFDRHVDELPTIAGPDQIDLASATVALDETPATVGNLNNVDQPQVSLDGLLGAWGTNNSTFDLNGDGTVNIDDLLQYIGQLGAPQNAGAESQRVASNIPAQLLATESAGKNQRGEQLQVRAQKLVDSLISRLSETGFEDHPPTNIRDLVSRLDLHPSQMNFVMHKLGERYPMGLGVNLKA